MKWTPALLSLIMVAMPAQAAAACMTRDEAKGFGVFILPYIVASLRDKCRATLPADAYLNRNEASERFQKASEQQWPNARKSFAKMADLASLANILGDDGVRKMMTGSITEGIAKDVKPKSCVGIDRMLFALAPLPVENFDLLLDSFFLLGLGGKGDSPNAFKICPDAANGKATDK